MTFPAVASVTGTTFGADATSHLANYPATVNAGDLLLIFSAFDGSSTTNTPTGYTAIATLNAQDPTHCCFAKSAAGSEGGGTIDVVTTNAQRGGVLIYRITGWSGVITGIWGNQRNAQAGATAAGNIPGLEAYQLQDWLWIASSGKSSTGSHNSPISGWGNAQTAGEDSTASARVYTCELNQATNIFLAQANQPWIASATAGCTALLVAVPAVPLVNVKAARSISAMGM